MQQVQRQQEYASNLELIRKEIEKENLKPVRLAPLTSMCSFFKFDYRNKDTLKTDLGFSVRNYKCLTLRCT